MLNALTVDVEDYFQVEAFASCIPYDTWDQYTPRVEQNVMRILDLFERHQVRATFFVLGWVAQRFPQLVRRISAAGHEVGCHGFAHRRLHSLHPAQFRADIRDARHCLMDTVQQPVRVYRAPSFSIVKKTLWAYDILAEEGFVLDSSVFPVRHDLYGMPDAERFPHWHLTSTGRAIFEFPPSTVRRGGNNWGVGGGGYLRLLPYAFTRWALRQINRIEKQPAMVYFHPWELDPGQPRIRAGFRSQFRHYINLSTTVRKIESLLRDFEFTTLSHACEQLLAYRTPKPVPMIA